MSDFSVVRGNRMRFTRVDDCGEIVYGTCSTVVTDGFVSVEYSANIEEAEEILLKNAAGQICILDTTCPELKWYDLEMEFCRVDPDLLSLMTGSEVVEDGSGGSVGISIGTKLSCPEGFALEVWANIAGASNCEEGGRAYGYFLVPWVTNAIIGDFSIENDAITLQVSARSSNNHAWGAGPYDVVLDDVGDPSPLLTPLDTDTHLLIQKTLLAPPELTDGCEELTAPS